MRRTSIMRMLTAMIVALPGLAAAKGPVLTVESGPSKNALVELYTSEGCSSCPPADRWLSSLAPNVTRDRIVPLSLHVDYWNYIGWADPFSDARFSQRQHARGGERIYTPEVFLDGEEVSREAFGERVAKVTATPAMAKIRVEATVGEEAIDLAIRAARSDGKRDAQVFIAACENNLVSRVERGENRGSELRHDFVVRKWVGPVKMSGGEIEERLSVGVDRSWKRKDLGVVIFVEDLASGKVLQVVRLPLVQ
jgi:hypothetical protein